MLFKDLEKKMFDFTDDLVKKTAQTLSTSNFTISTKEELSVLIKKSANKTYLNKETLEKKDFVKRSIVIIWDEKTDFFKDALFMLPVLWTKSFTENIYIKLAKKDITWVKWETYWLKEVPSMIVFENEKVYKIITWDKNILKVVKNLSLNINKTIDDL